MNSYVKFQLPSGGPVVVNADLVRFVGYENSIRNGETTVTIMFSETNKLVVVGTLDEVMGKLINSKSR